MRTVRSILTLRDAAVARHRLWAFCLNCGHGARFDPMELARYAGGDVALDDLGRRLRCRRCTQRQALLVAERIAGLSR
jgi:hypothetical protein